MTAQTVATPTQGTMLRTLRELRVEQHLSLADPAEASGIDKGTLSRIERGRIVATPAELASIGKALGKQLEVRTLPVYEESLRTGGQFDTSGSATSLDVEKQEAAE